MKLKKKNTSTLIVSSNCDSCLNRCALLPCIKCFVKYILWFLTASDTSYFLLKLYKMINKLCVHLCLKLTDILQQTRYLDQDILLVHQSTKKIMWNLAWPICDVKASLAKLKIDTFSVSGVKSSSNGVHRSGTHIHAACDVTNWCMLVAEDSRWILLRKWHIHNGTILDQRQNKIAHSFTMLPDLLLQLPFFPAKHLFG